MFRIIFVLDILEGKAVHAIKGERSKYLPVQGSRVCDSVAPLEIVSAVKPPEVYIADLDRLQHRGNNFGLIGNISGKTAVMVDIGAASMEDVETAAAIADTVVVGTETASFELIKKAAQKLGNRINVSIDIKNGRMLTQDSRLMVEPEELVRMLNDYDIGDIIILDLGRVGTGLGVDTDFLGRLVGISEHSILLGGGVRDMDDIEALKGIGVCGALVATAVHNGKIPVEAVRKGI
ncbi:MAG: HisA/HisF-related TIM barrel protein [Candidatus Methanoperedens sp.]|jgi:phosphoribosylformimino-5-aminoimidazole carboxamide ribotide isomerase|nr:HisA/HisF-related TIM barrel protein [Candidatus Methanoperedens sp.]PKL54092.1 MAG: phosphoribosylformimino-5-aminoimidazole carboxamide ribotide isomerase [Candidatus Methanoperedenaceae archaeon HGW-Methanoperedenaceae-1]